MIKESDSNQILEGRINGFNSSCTKAQYLDQFAISFLDLSYTLFVVLRFDFICTLRSQPAIFSWIMAEDIRLQRQRTLLLMMQQIVELHVHVIPFALEVPQGDADQSRWMPYTWRLSSQLWNCVEETPIFHHKLLVNPSNLYPGNRHYHYFGQQTSLSTAPKGDIISVFQGCSEISGERSSNNDVIP